MKKHLITFVLIAFSISLLAQQPYKYILIPTQFPEIGKGLNPHGISSAIQKILNEKSIPNKFQTDKLPDDYCETLLLDLENTSTMFKNKLNITLKDCNNRVIWQSEGVGQSKDYREGYAEAAANALKDMEQIPNIKEQGFFRPTTHTTQEPVQQTPVQQQQSHFYRPSNLYYNYTYFTDLIDQSQGSKKLLLMNAQQLGYNDNLKEIAILTPSEQTGNFTIYWENTDGEKVTGIAIINNQQLKITLPDGEKLKTIVLYHY